MLPVKLLQFHLTTPPMGMGQVSVLKAEAIVSAMLWMLETT
jgi:hypothetical protein